MTAVTDNLAEPLLYNAAQASARLNGLKTPNWLKTQAREGKIPFTRLGKTICFSEQNLHDLIAQESRDAGNGGRKKRR